MSGMERSSKRRRTLKRSMTVASMSVLLVSIAIAVTFLAVTPVVAQEAEVTVTVKAPEYVGEGETFVATIDVSSVSDLNSALFDLSFDPSVVEVTDVTDGRIDDTEIPIYYWDYIDSGTITVLSGFPVEVDTKVSGAGCLAKITFDVIGEEGDECVLDISNGELAKFVKTDTGMDVVEEIPADWVAAEIRVGVEEEEEEEVQVKVNAPEYVDRTFDVTIDVDSITDFNSGQFDLSFNASVVNVTDVADGSIDGETIPVDRWEFMDKDRISVILDVPGITGVSGSGYLAKINFEVVGSRGDSSVLDISNGLLVDTEAEEIPAEWIDDEVTVKVPVFDTDEGTYPSIFGTHEGTITPSKDIPVQKMYTYPCAGTGGHSEYVRIWSATLELDVSATWEGYTGDYHNIVFSETFTLYAGETYNYLIKTGSYPQIHHTDELEVDGGTIRCTKFTDANGKVSDDWIPAIKLW